MHYAKEFVKYDAAMLDLLQSLDDAKDAEQASPGLASGIENCEPEIAACLEHKYAAAAGLLMRQRGKRHSRPTGRS